MDFKGTRDNFFAPLSAINLGIGGDKVENILWRMEDMELPPTVDYLFLHCGTNNIGSSSPNDIADGVLAIGVMAKQANTNIQIIIGGLLHCDKELPTRSIVVEVNKILRQKIRSLKDFFYMEEDCDWIDGDGSLDMNFYHTDHLHLNNRNGNEKFANTIIRKLKVIESLSPSCSSDIILRIPSAEAPQKVARGVSSVLSPMSSVLSSLSSVCSSLSSSSRHVSSRCPLFTKVPKSVYDHRKQLLALSLRPLCVSSSPRCHRRSPRLPRRTLPVSYTHLTLPTNREV